MKSNRLEDTQQIRGKKSDNNPIQPKIGDTQPIPQKTKRGRVVLFGILAIIIFGFAGSGIGHLNGINQRLAKENEEVITQAALHYQYGIQQIQAGNYELARTQLEYVLQIYPDFPDAKQKYTEVLVKLAESGSPTQLAIQPTPTKDTRGAEALFNQALQEVQNQQWTAAMQTLETLRNEDYTYRTLEVDGLNFIALRYRAVELIVNEGNLEEGLYFFAVTERYAPLDHDAVNYASWARLYLTGTSFWEIDWAQVVNYFGQLAAAFPYLNDGSGWTATDRFIVGSENYGDQLVNEGNPCDALQQYQNALNYGENAQVQDKYNAAYLSCYPPTPIPQPTATPDPSLTETPETTEEPTETVDPEATQETPEGEGGG